MPTLEWILAEMKKLGYKIFTKDWSINIVAVRSLPGIPNSFDDWVCVFWMDQGKWSFEAFKATTDPGRYWLLNPGRINGTAILYPGQYLSSHKIGLHTGYRALTQNTTLKVWRDKDKDLVLDYTGTIYTDVAGLNIHHAGTASTLVEKWSAGCIVIANITDWKKFESIFVKSSEIYGDTFSLTLLEKK